MVGRYLLKDMTLKAPRAETPTHHIAMAFDPDLDEAAKQACFMLALI